MSAVQPAAILKLAWGWLVLPRAFSICVRHASEDTNIFCGIEDMTLNTRRKLIKHGIFPFDMALPGRSDLTKLDVTDTCVGAWVIKWMAHTVFPNLDTLSR